MSKPLSKQGRGNASEPPSHERASLEALVEAVVAAAYEVSNILGAGFLEKIYERALSEELSLRGLRVKTQARTVKKLERAEGKERMMVRFDEEEPSGAPVSVRDRDGESAASGAE